MKNESVAIFDIRSYELTFLIGGRGVNGTFVFRGSESDFYDGYGADGFFFRRNARFQRRALFLRGYDAQTVYRRARAVYQGAHERADAFVSETKKNHGSGNRRAFFVGTERTYGKRQIRRLFGNVFFRRG